MIPFPILKKAAAGNPSSTLKYIKNIFDTFDISNVNLIIKYHLDVWTGKQSTKKILIPEEEAVRMFSWIFVDVPLEGNKDP